MATPATLEQWKELYDLAIEITKLKPWNSYWDMDLIAVDTCACSTFIHYG